MLFPRVSSSGLRLVPETNTQNRSAPRLPYKTFVGAKPARSRRRMNRMSEPMPLAKSEPDWANQKHFWRLVPAGSSQQEQGELENTPEAVEAWAAALQQRFGGRPIAVCLEQV